MRALLTRRVALFGAAFVLVSACTGDPDTADTTESGCETVASQALEFIQGVIDDLGGRTLDDAFSDEPINEELSTRPEQFQDQAVGLGCSETEFNELLMARVGELQARGPAGEFLIEEIRSQGFGIPAGDSEIGG